ncbi:hypothetical protein EON83_01265 [bacterium]|nr:MAG: hypothetical protein EON83_01265 [bacterium]
MQTDWQSEVRKFRDWAEPQIQIAEWECNYEHWDAIYTSVEEFLKTDSSLWSEQETEDLLYILARDWEFGTISESLKEHSSETAIYISEKSLDKSDFDARWQLADVLGYFPSDTRTEPLVRRFVDDEEEYVRRRALQSLVRLGAIGTEQLALREWNTEDDNQQWARMNALQIWRHINSSLLESHLLEAEASADKFPYLADFAHRLRKGEIDFA